VLEWPTDSPNRDWLPAAWRPVPFQQFILKLHSRCNLACTYCYVYESVDQSWRRQPVAMSRATLDHAVDRIAEHVEAHRLTGIEILFHGGEPLLTGGRLVAAAAKLARGRVDPRCAVRFGAQTNGTLLTEQVLAMARKYRVRLGVSMDGARGDHDRQRVYRDGHGSHDAVRRGLELLQRSENRSIYAGLLCTVDLRADPLETYRALLSCDPPVIDFLLPHANWRDPPASRSRSDRTYGEWLIAIFEEWFPMTTAPSVRLFTEILVGALGGQSRSEAVGLSPAASIVIETDGSIEQLDALKSSFPGAPALGLTVTDNSLDEALHHPMTAARQSGRAALCGTCRECRLVDVCGGGYFPHRYRPGTGFRNPSVYCPDLTQLISHIIDRVRTELAGSAPRSC
jgi:uncharacterized protein